MKRPWLVKMWLTGLQDSDAHERHWIKRTHVDDPRGIESRLKELDEKREREAPVVQAYVMAALTVAVPIAVLIWWLVAA
ncbi:hypothetical protein ASD54_08610 [Rhizobium sp. Root149]|uniref:hypothetical protein n=1 Tax=Rhizobium sp. Root149 TaxID=1736473 RepID=UPI000712E99B|nr:hypothetical protein [Rhizobium sp. Root149]KQZ50306.1 hypothetical protein ASD54_08610 [Rhizobium sp. Root149]